MPLLLLCIVFLFSCQKLSEPFAAGEPARTMQTDLLDREISQIAGDARDTLPGFFRHLNSKKSGENGFSVKYPLAADDGSGVGIEQVWLTGIQFKDGVYYGILAGSPTHLNGMKKGDKIIFDTEIITDWMYMQNGKIIGGYSIKYLLEKIPEDQRSEKEQKLLSMFY
jgi:uncharacterized protein YegJ (DUF2314 family)